MLPGISEIKERRTRLGLTQSGLAHLVGVSQSLVTKAESGKLMPSYEKAKRMFDVLENREADSAIKASDIMTRKVASIRPCATISSAVKLMKRLAVSQLPVIDGSVHTGSFSEKLIVSKMHDGQNMDGLGETQVSEVMEEAMPIVQESTPLSAVSSLLEHNQALLVAKAGKIVGIITKADLLNVMLAKRGKKGFFR